MGSLRFFVRTIDDSGQQGQGLLCEAVAAIDRRFSPLEFLNGFVVDSLYVASSVSGPSLCFRESALGKLLGTQRGRVQYCR